MNCQNIKKLLIPFLESDLPESDRAAIEAHLYECDDCRKEKALLENTWSMLDGLQSPEVSGNFTRNLMVRIHEQENVELKPVFALPGISVQFAFRVLVPALASVCVLIVVYMLTQNNPILRPKAAKEVAPIQGPVTQSEKSASMVSEAKVAEVAPVEIKEDAKIIVTELAKDEKPAMSAVDLEIIRNLDVYKNIELYQNYELLNDFDVVENMGAKGV